MSQIPGEIPGPIVAGGLLVCDRECHTCIFRKGNVMHLRSGRVRQMVNGAREANTAIVCHKTLHGTRAVCRGYWDRHKHDTLLTRLGLALGVREVNPDEYE